MMKDADSILYSYKYGHTDLEETINQLQARKDQTTRGTNCILASGYLWRAEENPIKSVDKVKCNKMYLVVEKERDSRSIFVSTLVIQVTSVGSASGQFLGVNYKVMDVDKNPNKHDFGRVVSGLINLKHYFYHEIISDSFQLPYEEVAQKLVDYKWNKITKQELKNYLHSNK